MPSYVLLEKITVGAAGASSVTFSGIPQTGYTDLVIKASARSADSGNSDSIAAVFNANTSSYTNRFLYGTGSSTGSATAYTTKILVGELNAATSGSDIFSNLEMYVPNYTTADYKSISSDAVQEKNASTGNNLYLVAGLWSNTAAITSIQLLTASGANLTQYSTFYLYGVAALGTTPAIVPYATGGDTIMTDGTYWYHTFISSGTFTPQKAIICDYLVVAGGGAGGYGTGAGGGAGGYRTSIGGSPLPLGTSAVTVTVGAGGTGATSVSAPTNGTNSIFSTITSSGGGKGANNTIAPSTGGSGGGGDNSTLPGAAGNAGSYSPAEGFAGGNGRIGSGGGGSGDPYGSGGGGGASAVGVNASVLGSGAGGAGTSNSISGSAVTYAGGGGGGGDAFRLTPSGGAGGVGGGGAGGATGGAAGTAGTANTGGGGGGGANNSPANGGNGGSGIVVVRYLV